jgi:hypothetical protein
MADKYIYLHIQMLLELTEYKQAHGSFRGHI